MTEEPASWGAWIRHIAADMIESDVDNGCEYVPEMGSKGRRKALRAIKGLAKSLRSTARGLETLAERRGKDA